MPWASLYGEIIPEPGHCGLWVPSGFTLKAHSAIDGGRHLLHQVLRATMDGWGSWKQVVMGLPRAPVQCPLSLYSLSTSSS